MSASTWFRIAMVGFSLAGMAMIASIVIFFRLNIWAVIGDLTGRTAAQEVKAIRAVNAKNENKKVYARANPEYRTGALKDTVTAVLGDNPTKVLKEQTEVLNEIPALDETRRLAEAEEQHPAAFIITRSVLCIHTEEVVPVNTVV